MIGIGTGVPVIRTLGKAGNAHVYESRAEFVVDEATPLTSPHTNVPGPGILVFIDTEDKFSISGGQLVCAGGKAVPANGDPATWDESVSRASGVAMIWEMTLTSDATGPARLGWDTDQAGAPNEDGMLLTNLTVQMIDAALATGIIATLANDTTYQTALILRSAGSILAIKGGTFLVWTPLYISNTATTATLFATLMSNNRSFTSTFLRVLNLPIDGYPIWSTDFGLATDRLAGARSASDTFTHGADCLIEFEATTLPSAGNIRVRFRIQDSSNHWRITCAADGSISLDDVVAGVPTTRIFAGAGTLIGGERIVVVVDDGIIRLYADNVVIGTSSMLAEFITETSGELNDLGTAGAVSDIVAWPRFIGQLVNTDLLVGTVSDDSAFTHDSDCRIVFTINTLPSSGNVVVEFRRQDANDYWRVSINSVGDLALQKVLNGVGQGNHILGSGVLSGGERVTVVAHENHYTLLFDDTLVGTHNDSFVLFNSFTDGRVGLGTGGVVDDLVTWPLPANAGDEAFISLEAVSA